MNLSSIIALGVVLVIVGLLCTYFIKKHIKGKSNKDGCTGNCSGCPYCH